jgi:SNF2 family DNA or RNA helicase
MRLAVYHGSDRCRQQSKFWKTDIILTTYETLRLEWAAAGPLYSGTWRRVVLDEGKGHDVACCLNVSLLSFQRIIFGTDRRNYSRRPWRLLRKAAGA